MPTHCAHRDERNRHKRAAPTARNGVTPPLRHSHIERKTNHRNKKKNRTLVYSEFWFYFCRSPPEKHTTSRDSLPTSHPPVPPSPLVPRIGTATLREVHLQPHYLAMKTLFLLFLTALGFTACTRRVVEHVEVHDTLRHSISDTLKELITLTDSVFIHDSTFIGNGIPVRSQVIFHRQLIDRTSQHLHQSERDHARRQKTQHSAVRSAPFPFPGATKPWLWVVLGVGVGLGIGKIAWKR